MARDKNIKTPEELWKLFTEYVDHEQKNPMTQKDWVGKDAHEVTRKLEVPITFEGFECYLADKGVINDLGDYAANTNEAYTEFSTIITRIRKNCFSHNFKGAAVGLFNPNLIARKLGLIDKTQTDINANVKVLENDPLADD